MIRHYVEFLYPGLIFSDSTAELVESREAPVNAPANACGYRFFDREEVDTDEEVLRGTPKNHSGWTYFGEALTLEEVRVRHPEKRVLISNMEGNRIPRVAHAHGAFLPMQPEDRAVAP